MTETIDTKPTRKYAPIWNKLKVTGICKIAVHHRLHKRIIKAVIKEKNSDLGYAFQLAEKREKARLKCERIYDSIVFTLIKTKSIGIEDI